MTLIEVNPTQGKLKPFVSCTVEGNILIKLCVETANLLPSGCKSYINQPDTGHFAPTKEAISVLEKEESCLKHN